MAGQYMGQEYDNLSQLYINELETKYHKYFIENRTASWSEWIHSRGTSFQCYLQYLNGLDEQAKIDNTIDTVRNILYAFNKPFQSYFFYWTLLIFILHKFNFKKPIMKLVTLHFIFRTTGDILFQIANLWNTYPITSQIKDKFGNITYGCDNGTDPFKFLITQQIGVTFGNLGEIVGDWYLLFRTRAVVKNQKALIPVYFTCGIFNLLKVVLAFIHWIKVGPTKLYYEDGSYRRHDMDIFYFYYWSIQFLIIITSILYDLSVYFVLRNNVFKEMKSEFGFVKKFKDISEFRIIICIFISILFLPLVLVSIGFKFYFYWKRNMDRLNFAFDEIRTTIINVQYIMIFIDQILLMRSKGDSSNNTTTSSTLNKNNYLNAFSSNNSGKFQYTSLNNNKNLGIYGNMNSNFNYSNNNNSSNNKSYYSSNGNTNSTIVNDDINNNNLNLNLYNNFGMLNSSKYKELTNYNNYNHNNYNHNNYNHGHYNSNSRDHHYNSVSREWGYR
ncbi:hypothetical protein BCR32DRAFT_268283 [Anaeromyces robustus]|uniref:Uncharacterized protein n=1 Tax=Anaeromyces robustus TaxID=1754192 RepID=A0A1Y1X6W1_9FUNG|nr:hypothetical protein BCR32DRAFT_268283 [Anaeromyces robustus]|eukprot:ORX81428.1 hypothetical protein BCR32DRAFT_268283 [Anaeromyces robustus]